MNNIDIELGKKKEKLSAIDPEVGKKKEKRSKNETAPVETKIEPKPKCKGKGYEGGCAIAFSRRRNKI